MDEPKIGTIGWVDLTVDDAEAVKDFYSAVCGWTAQPHDMGDYTYFNLLSADGETVAGICHVRGANQKLPPMCLPYVTVPALTEALEAAEARGGTIIEKRLNPLGAGLAIIGDPAGACFALWQARPSV